MKIYRCNVCGKIVALITGGVKDTTCCNKVMEELVPKDEETENNEKHVPCMCLDCDTLVITIGECVHPSTLDHHIEWVLVEYTDGYQIKYLNYIDKPRIVFKLCRRDRIKAIYAYCNIHGLWKLDVDDD